MKNWSSLLALTLTIALFLSACGSSESETAEQGAEEEQDTFTIGVIPAQTEGEMDTAMKKLQELLTTELDREVEIEVYPDYNGVVEAMNYDQIDMAYLGPLTFVIAEANSNAKAIITQLIDGKPYYHSYIITHKDNPWNTLDEMLADSKEVDFAFGDPNSTSGSLIPSIELQEQGVYQSEDDNEFATVRFTGSHDATALAIENKQVDAGQLTALFMTNWLNPERLTATNSRPSGNQKNCSNTLGLCSKARTTQQ